MRGFFGLILCCIIKLEQGIFSFTALICTCTSLKGEAPDVDEKHLYVNVSFKLILHCIVELKVNWNIYHPKNDDDIRDGVYNNNKPIFKHLCHVQNEHN